MTGQNYSVKSVHETLLETFHQYLSAQYHIWDEWLISERNRILDEAGNTYQEPRLEATPQYATGRPYCELNIPEEAKAILTTAAEAGGTGIPKNAYTHQCHAIETFVSGKDLIVATGTGSGKTESFLMPILSSLAMESVRRPKAWKMPATRALLLYPMNALVNDQLGRLRRLLGNQAVWNALRGNSVRGPRFGMYTSRSPYPGDRTERKDRDRVRGELNKLYFEGMTDDYRERLQQEGKWPAKDLDAFLSNNLKTGPADVELISRHEMQDTAPDLLVTNYSMLEYMMLRPIEAPIFEKTAEWLHADDLNHLTIVLDEAHMYRGSGGAEVAYLLRRLQSRLGIARDKLRFILTSASLGSSTEAKTEIKEFAAKLTGGNATRFELVTGTLHTRSGGQPASPKVQKAFSTFDYSTLLGSTADLAAAHSSLKVLAASVDVALHGPSAQRDELQQLAFDLLCKLPVAALVAERLTQSPNTLAACAEIAFPAQEGRETAAEALLALMAFARDRETGRPFCPIRSHLFFRGLPGLYACTNVECGNPDSTDASRLLGRLHPNEALRCECGARVYELLTHRSCGAAYLRAFMQGGDGTFLWHQPSNGTWTESQLIEAQFYVVPEAELEQVQGTVVWLHTPTGQLVPEKPASTAKGHYLALLRPDTLARDRSKKVMSLQGDCPACDQRTRADAPIAMDLATKGEAPFAHIVRAQVATQPISRPPTSQIPNSGRKTIVFSDGRQKAARLARDIPREIELDVFRQALFIATQELNAIGKEARLDDRIYVAFLKCLHDRKLRFFDGSDRMRLDDHLNEFVRYYDSDLEAALEAGLTAPPSFWTILLKQLGTPYYSISALTLGYVVPIKAMRTRILGEHANLPREDLEAIVAAWIQRLLARFSFGRDIPDGVRRQASRYPFRPASAIDGFSKLQKEFFAAKGLDAEKLAQSFAKFLGESKPDGSLYLSPRQLILKPALNEKWAQCERCKTVSPALILGHCPNCVRPTATLVDPDSTSYLRARKGFWRDPVARAIDGSLPPMNIDVQEHSAQLSYKDAEKPSPTTEVFERQFRDILRPGERAVDVLSCTTTMEVGIDIGSLIAVSMRNVPPMRQNYQQRAGRAGRRGSAVSTVVTYAQSGAHDAYYFRNPDKMLAGDPPRPVLDTSNDRIAERHLFAQLLQDFFRPLARSTKSSSNIFTALGDTWDFFTADTPAGLAAFKHWVSKSDTGHQSLARAQLWLPEGLDASNVASSMIAKLEACAPRSQEGLESSLIEFLFARGLLPSYAFPTDICSLQIQEQVPGSHGDFQIVEQAQQGLGIALSEYAPGRLVVLNKKTYRIGTVAASGPDTEVDRAAALFAQGRVYRHCTECSYTAGFIQGDDGSKLCPQCGAESLRTMTVIRPETVFPSGRADIDEFDDEQVFSRVTQAQLPLPDEQRRIETEPFGKRGGLTPRRQQKLVVVNEGDPDATNAGFRVCNKCGKVLAEGEVEGPHTRDYYIKRRGAAPQPRCSGEFQRVFLGYSFTSDILLLRVTLAEPLRFSITSRRDRKPLEDALQTLCEALTLSIGRVLDIDAREVSAGYRFGNDGISYFADIFVYDTLSGGAGYALQAGKAFTEIFKQAKQLMSDCTCQSSCENCLRHYGNRFSHSSLDRHLGIDLARYIESGEVPGELSAEQQLEALKPLLGMVELAGWDTKNDGQHFDVEHNGTQFRLTACPSLRACTPKDEVNGRTVLTFTPYELSRDLPSAFAELK